MERGKNGREGWRKEGRVDRGLEDGGEREGGGRRE